VEEIALCDPAPDGLVPGPPPPLRPRDPASCLPRLGMPTTRALASRTLVPWGVGARHYGPSSTLATCHLAMATAVGGRSTRGTPTTTGRPSSTRGTRRPSAVPPLSRRPHSSAANEPANPIIEPWACGGQEGDGAAMAPGPQCQARGGHGRRRHEGPQGPPPVHCCCAFTARVGKRGEARKVVGRRWAGRTLCLRASHSLILRRVVWRVVCVTNTAVTSRR
jgi:hypothetical protein